MSAFFHEIAPEEMDHLDLKVELAAQNFSNNYKVFSGAMTFYRGAEIVHLASLSFSEQ
jgi:hypothetical protein